jgi:hypothetical protein
MNQYLKIASPLSDLISTSFKCHFRTLKSILVVILLMVVAKNMHFYLTGYIHNRTLYAAALIIMLLLQVFLAATALVLTDASLRLKQITLNEAFSKVYKNSASIFAGAFFFVLIFCLVVFVGMIVAHFISGYVKSQVMMTLITSAVLILPVISLIILWIFAIPLLVLKPMTMWSCFKQSMSMIRQDHWMQGLVLYVCYVIFYYLLKGNTHHGIWLSDHHVSIIADFFIFALVFPFLLNFTLFLLCDFMMRDDKPF